MPDRLVSAARVPRTPLVPIPVGILVLALVLSRVPWTIAHPELARTWVAPEAKAVFLYFASIVIVGLVLVLALQALVGLGVLASLYGSDGRQGPVLATPLGVVGYWRQRLRLESGVVQVGLVEGVRPSRWHRYGVQHLYISQGDRAIHVVSSIRFAPDSRRTLTQWLESRGLTAEFHGDSGVLPP